MTAFVRVTVNELLPEAIAYLEKAIKRTPASTSRLDVTLKMAEKYGELYHVMGDGLIGAMYLLTYNSDEGKVLSPFLVGGIKMHLWRDALHDFLIDEGRKAKAIAIRYIGRKGWGKFYPMCDNIGTIYEFRL